MNNKINDKGLTLWFTGLSGAGKSTISLKLKSILKDKCFILDGDIIRKGLNSDLGFSREDRRENIRRISEVAKLFNSTGMVVVVAFISPFEEDRLSAKISHKENGLEFREIYIKASLECCEKRDPKGLYKKARNGEIKNFTGISDPYEIPSYPDLILDTETQSLDELVLLLLKNLINPHSNLNYLETSDSEAIILDEEELNILQIIQQGWCPVKCFMNEEQLLECLYFKTYEKNKFQPLPLILPINTKEKEKIESLNSQKKPLKLINKFTNSVVGLLNNPNYYSFRKEEICTKIFGTFSTNHPKINKYNTQGEFLLTGDSITFLEEIRFEDGLDDLRLSPQKLFELYKEKEADCIYAFQVRNPLHNGHCMLLNEARRKLIADGYKNPVLLLHPCGGWTKDDDVPLKIRVDQYKALLQDKALDQESTILAIWPSPMYYAGPMEVLWHFSSREYANVDYMIVGRDPAGIKHPENYQLDLYDPLHGQKILEVAFNLGFIKTKIIPFRVVCYNYLSKEMEFFNQSNVSSYLNISGSELRKLAREGKSLPDNFMNEKGWNILSDYYNKI